MIGVEDRKRALEARRKELEWKLVEIEDSLDEQPPADSEERATEREGDEVLEKLGESGQHEIAMIDAALKRIEDGTYGHCTVCGDEIAEARLNLLPETPFCRICAAKL